LYDAGEISKGLKLLQLFRKPGPFQLGADDPNDPKVQQTLGLIGRSDTSKMPKPEQLMMAQLAFANSDLAFRGKYLFQGNFYGVNIYDISNPAKAQLVTSMVCPGGQGDVSVYKNLMFMSVEMPNGRIDCGIQGFPPAPAPAAGKTQMPPLPAPNKERFRGVRIFDISDIRSPKQVAAVQTCRGCILSKIRGSRKMPGRKIALNLRGLIFLPHIFLLKPGPVRDTPPRIFETILAARIRTRWS
jgi:hypothetical protein